MENLNRLNRLGGFYDQVTRLGLWDKHGIAPTICASMGMGGGHIPMIVRRMSNAKELSNSRKCVK